MTSYRKHTQLISLLIISSFSLTACETVNQLHLGPKLGIKIPIKKTILIDESEKQLVSDVIEQGDDTNHKKPEKKTQRKSEISWGTGKFIKSVPASAQKKTQAGKYTINFDAADIGEVSKIILSDMLHVNYVLSPKVRGQVTLQTTQALKKEQLLPTLEMLLQINGAVLIKQGDMYRIEPAATALGIADASQLNSQQIKSGYQVKVIPLSYISAADMADIITPIVPAKSIVRVDVARNLLLVAGNGNDLSKVLELVKTFDINFIAGMSFALFPLENLEVEAALTDIEKIFNKTEKTPLSGMLRFIAIKHLNALLVISQQKAYLKEAEAWIKRLDKGTDALGENGGVIVYRVQHVDATELAATLNSIINGGSSTATRQPSVAAGRKLATISNKKISKVSSTRSSGTGNKLLQGVTLIADEPNNALIVLAEPQQYRMLKKIIERLDVMPLQVLIDATIVSVKLEDNLSYGVQWKFTNSGPDGMDGIGLLGAAAQGFTAAGTGGFSYGLQRSSSDIRMIFDTLAKDNKINVLSSPSLMVLNNQEATIKVGDSIPIRTTESTNTNASVNPIQTSSIKMLDTGIILTVKPRVNASGIVILKIKQNVDTATVTNSSKIDSPTILKRQIESTVAVVSGESVVLGGLISEEHTYDNTGMPFLKDIPYIGWLFGSQSKKIVKNELIVVITPRVVGNKFDARQVTDEFKRKLTGIYYDEGQFKLKASQVKRGYDGLELRTDEQNAQDLAHRLKPWEAPEDKNHN